MGLTLVYFVAFPTRRLMMEFDLLTFSFGQLPLALVTWVPMFLSTLLVPYQALRLWERPQSGGAWTLRVGLGCLLLAAHTVVLGILPVHVAVEYQLPPASRCVLVFEQVGGGQDQGWGGAPGREGTGYYIGGGRANYQGQSPLERFEPTSSLQTNVNKWTLLCKYNHIIEGSWPTTGSALSGTPLP